MIDREKIVCAIENCIGLSKCKDCPWEDCEVEHEVVNRVPYGLLRDALVLLKEQEPMKPTWSQGKLCCGNCGHGLPRKRADREINYCSYCGQAVKWNADGA